MLTHFELLRYIVCLYYTIDIRLTATRFRLPIEMIRVIVNKCDLATLLALRRTCVALYTKSHEILMSDRQRLLQRYVERQDVLWQHLDDARAVVGGFAALGFMLRDHDACGHTLDIYASSNQGRLLEQVLEEDPDLDLSVVQVQRLEDDYRQIRRHVSRTVTFATKNGCFIKLHISLSLSTYDPIATSLTSALINWVSPHAFACGYPALTLARRGLALLDGDPGSMEDHLAASLRDIGFDVRPDPTTWPQYAAIAPPSRRSWQFACMRMWYVCPHQGRFFGDEGSLLTVFDLLGVNHNDLKRQRRSPYGIGVAWRISIPYMPCDGPCTLYDPLLPEEVLTLPAVFIDQGVELRIAHVEYSM